MKKTFVTLLSTALLGLAVQSAHASVVVSNLDPSNIDLGLNGSSIGQATLIGARPVSLTSVQFLQTAGITTGESLAVYARNADGTVGSPLFASFTLSYDPTMDVTTAMLSGAFTLQANSGYYFVLNSNSTTNAEWNYTNTTDYASAFGASLPATGDDSFSTMRGTTAYYTLAQGPQQFQVNGIALAAVPEPSTWALTGLALAGGVVWLARRRAVAA